jgi:NitT/TauT family transport system permease protein
MLAGAALTAEVRINDDLSINVHWEERPGRGLATGGISRSVHRKTSDGTARMAGHAPSSSALHGPAREFFPRKLVEVLGKVWAAAFPFLVVAGLWELVAHLGLFPPRLFPPIETIAAAFLRLTVAGILPRHAIETVFRLLAGFAIAGTVGVAIGIAMGRSRRAQDIFLPLVSIGAPIPGLAYAPLFLLWFGLGNLSAILLVGFVASFPVILNTWTGVKAVKEIWIRSAIALGADNRRMFRKVILPGALPYILTGLRLGLAQGWRILVAVEMLASVSWGLGWLIFGAREFLNIDVMLAAITVIAIIGLTLEKLVFQRLEDFTVVRWGMIAA